VKESASPTGPGSAVAAAARAAAKRGLRALKAKRFAEADGALSVAIAADPNEATLWHLRAISRAKRGLWQQVEHDLVRAIELSGEGGGMLESAMRLAGKGALAVTLLEAAARSVSPRSRAIVVERLARERLALGRYHEGLAAWREAVALGATRERRLGLASVYADLGDVEAALAELAERGGGDAAGHELEARLLVAAGRFEESKAAVGRALALRPATGESLLAAVQGYIQAGALGEARATALRAIEAEPKNVSAHLALGELELWGGDYDEAKAAAETALALDADNAEAWRLRGASRIMRADANAKPNDAETRRLLAAEISAAEGDIERALSRAPKDAEARVWRAEIERTRGSFAKALGLLDDAMPLYAGYALPAYLLRQLTVLEMRHAERRRGPVDPDVHAELVEILAPILGSAPAPREQVAAIARLKQARRAFAGNRGLRPTYVSNDGSFLPLDLPLHSRFAARRAQELIRVRPPDEVLAMLERMADERRDAATVLCHLGEVQLWLGDYDAARDSFLRAIRPSPRARWAYVGLCAQGLMRGKLDEALAWSERSIAVCPPLGRTMYAYRAEVHYRRGDLDAALSDIRQMLELTPNRISSHVLLALIEARRGNPAALIRGYAHVRHRAPAMVSDAQAELPPLGEASSAPIPQHLEQLFEHLLTMMRGNRASSLVTYFTRDGLMRFVPTAAT
jgi:tetratricopeptide (TPR) repeat protein